MHSSRATTMSILNSCLFPNCLPLPLFLFKSSPLWLQFPRASSGYYPLLRSPSTYLPFLSRIVHWTSYTKKPQPFLPRFPFPRQPLREFVRLWERESPVGLLLPSNTPERAVRRSCFLRRPINGAADLQPLRSGPEPRPGAILQVLVGEVRGRIGLWLE